MVWAPGWSPVQDGARVLVHHRQRFLLIDGRVLLDPARLPLADLALLGRYGIGTYADEPVMVWETVAPLEIPGGEWRGMRQIMLEGDGELFAMLGYASQIGNWARLHRFCGVCGAPTQARGGQWAMACGQCGEHYYPRLSPSMIVLVTRGDEILLGRSPRFAPGVYSTLAGFVEPGESVEACVAREVREEVGVAVRNTRYQASQGWPFPHSLMLGFHTEYAGGEIVCQPDEIEDARWFGLDDLPGLPPRQAISRYLIELYIARRKGLPEPTLPR